ncbi:MAG: hybrid sensor histidine kinase/response regulator, partial [Thermodesulfobacteriota bacterium]
SLNIDEIMEIVVDSIYNRVDAVDHVSIYQVEGEIARLRSYRGYPDWFIKKIEIIEPPKGATWKCINDRMSIHVNNSDEDKYLGDAAKKVGTKSYISTPIFLHGNPIGCIHIQSKEISAFDKNEVSFLDSLSQQIANAINTTVQDQALKESEQRYRTLFDQSPVGICMIDKSQKITHCNQSMVDIFQSDFDKIIGLDLNQLSDKTFVPIIEKAMQGHVCSNESYYEASTSSAKLWLNATVVPLYELNNKDVVGVMGVVEDITERRIAENKLRESEERYRSIVEHTSDVVVETTYEGKFLYLSPNCYDILGFKQEELVGTSLFEYIHPDDLASVIKEFSSSIQEMRTGRLILRSKHKNGEWRWFETIGKPYKTASNEIKAVITAHDITDKKQQEEEDIKSQKLESLSVLAGGIAHDFNNILTIVISNLTLADMHLEGNSQVTDIISAAKRASFRASDLTNQLRTFAKGSSMIKQPMLLNNFLNDCVSFSLRGSNVSNEFIFADDVIVEIDEGQINQVINNLVINAKQAMPNGGQIKISTEKVNIENNRSLGLESGDYVKISIADEGVGISKENLGKIFDPYFTTKEKGSGLGLATSYSIIQKHGGLISVNSKIGEGTQCDIYLPHSPDDEYQENKIASSNGLSGKGRLLIMDDEDGIREVVSLMLNKIGFEVDAVKNGEEAIKVYGEFVNKNSSYVAVILDLTIPGGMGGVETVKKLKEIDPEVFCIVSSAYSDDPVIEQYMSYGFSAYLNKPFSITELKELLVKIQESQLN